MPYREKFNMRTKAAIAAFLIILGVMVRFALVTYVDMPNLEIITALALISGAYLGGIYGIAVPLLTIFLSDLVIGNNYIFIFTWTAFALIGLYGYLCSKKIRASHGTMNSREKSGDGIKNSVHLAIIASVFFYLFTNFGWWLMSGTYEYSIRGLLECYYMGLPFFRNNLIGNLIFVPLAMTLFSKIMHSIRSEYEITLKSNDCMSQNNISNII